MVLRTHKLGEADRIVVIMGAERGKIRAVAKGIRRTSSKFGARLEPLSHVSLQLVEGRDLDTVTQVETVDPHRAVREDLDRLGRATALLETVDAIAPEREPAPHLYRMLCGGLATLAAQDAPAVVGSFLWKLLAVEGLEPVLDHCVSCGSVGDVGGFSPEHGGVVCRSCRAGAQPLSAEALMLIGRVLGGDLVAVLAEEPTAATWESERLAARTFEHQMERRLRSLQVLGR